MSGNTVCPSCATPYTAHPGLIHQCRELAAARDALREILAQCRMAQHGGAFALMLDAIREIAQRGMAGHA